MFIEKNQTTKKNAFGHKKFITTNEMLTLKPYQQNAVEGLLKETYEILRQHRSRQKLVFKAPTGSGKTVMMAEYLNRLAEELPDKYDLPERKVAFIWIAPNQLHEQSFRSIKTYFSELRNIRPIFFEDITDDKLQENEVLFLNWQSINKKENIYIRENEQSKNLSRFINGARINRVTIIVILDEAHLYAAKGKKAAELLEQIYAKIEIEVSATPMFNSDYKYIIKRPEVVEAQMIKQNIVLNPAITSINQNNQSLNHILLNEGLKQRKKIADAYRELGIKINPLLLIQLPNDNSLTESEEERKIKDEVIYYLDSLAINTGNQQLAIWLSGEYTNVEGIERNDNFVTDVLLFKQAISLGWDCPRAAVLVIFRELKQETFTIQTVGRILRMPEQKHYSNSLLNHGYVYTNLSKDMISIIQDDMDLIVMNKALRVSNYEAIKISSEYINHRIIRNRLESAFRRIFYQTSEQYFGVNKELKNENIYEFNKKCLQAKMVNIDVKNIEIAIPKDIELSGEIETVKIESDHKERFAKNSDDIYRLFKKFCLQNIGGYEKHDSPPVLELAIKFFLQDYLGFSEYDGLKIILYDYNKPIFIEVIELSLVNYAKYQAEKAKNKSQSKEKFFWDVPAERLYNELFKEKPEVKTHALEPFFEQINASTPEKEFALFLEQNKQYLDWWYKNGEKNKTDFAITYKNRYGEESSFYVDFVLKFKSGKIGLFDTKTPDSEPEFCNKHNALINYISEFSKPEKELIGGVIVPQKISNIIMWKYCDNLITDARDTTGWLNFNPANC